MLLPDVLGAPLGCAATIFGVALLTDPTLGDYERRRGRAGGLRSFGVALLLFGGVFAGGPAMVGIQSSLGGPLTVAQLVALMLVAWLWRARRTMGEPPRRTRADSPARRPR